MKIQKLGRRDFLKRVGLAAPVFLGNAAAIAGGGNFASPKMSTGTNLIKPARLQFGDVVGVAAPASAPPDPAEVDRSFAALEKFGFKPKLAANVRERLGFLAGTDEERANDLMALFADRDVKAIFCLRGGYGSARLLSRLDFHFIKKHPKIFIGFSDITSLHCALLTHSKLVSFHGPTLNTNLTGDAPEKFLTQSLWRAVMEAKPAGSICEGYSQSTISILNKGIAKGQLVGGNLSVLCTTLGTPFQPRFKDNILFFEDVSEQPYRFDRMLTHLLNAGLLQEVAGVAVGINKDCEDPDAAKTKEYLQTLDDVLKDRLTPLGVPVVTGLPFGHVVLNGTLPVGISATLDGDNGDLIVNEAAVS
jgi:muramoyltetrapeptide carboxypeptidase